MSDPSTNIILCLQEGHCDGETPAATVNGPTTGGNGVQSLLYNSYTNELSKVGSDVATATEETLKVLGRMSLATAGLLTTLWNGASQTTAKTGETLNQGYQMVNQVTGRLPVIGTLTTGVGNALAGITDTFSANSKFGNEQRFQFINGMRTKLNDFVPVSKTTTSTVTEDTTKTSASAAEVKKMADMPNSATV